MGERLVDDEIIYDGSTPCCGSFCDWMSGTKWHITTNYIEKESGVCCKKIEHIDLVRVNDIAWEQDCCCCCCGCSTITVYSSDATCPKLSINGLTDGKKIFRRLRDTLAVIRAGAKIEIES